MANHGDFIERVETLNQRVAGSSPATPASLLKDLPLSSKDAHTTGGHRRVMPDRTGIAPVLEGNLDRSRRQQARLRSRSSRPGSKHALSRPTCIPMPLL